MYNVPTNVAAGAGGGTAAGAVWAGWETVLFLLLAGFALIALGVALYRAGRTFTS